MLRGSIFYFSVKSYLCIFHTSFPKAQNAQHLNGRLKGIVL
nr:MAG TPA: hypothetical protein [Caudoviricetes sp.]